MSAFARTLGIYSAAAGILLLRGVTAPPGPEVVHIDSSFDAGRNRYEWRTARTGSCAEGSSAAASDRLRHSSLTPPPDALAPDALFLKGSFEMRAVSGTSRVHDPDECGVFLYTLLGRDEAGVHNQGRPRGDIRADIRFRLLTPSTVFTVLIAFGEQRWRYIALMIPASGIAAVPYTAEGRMALMRPAFDLESDLAPLAPGATAHLTVLYHHASDSVEAFLDGRRATFSQVLTGGPRPILVARRFNRVDSAPWTRRVPRTAALLELYSEAQLDVEADSRVELRSVRVASRMPSPVRGLLGRAGSWMARPLFEAEFRIRLAMARLRRKSDVLLRPAERS